MSTLALALEAPHYRATYSVAIRRFFLKYATFSGRASRSEYWWWVLTSVLVSCALATVGGLSTGDWNFASEVARGPLQSVTTVPGVLSLVFRLATLVPSLALTWRRLHDANLDGTWFFIVLIPVAGAIILLVLTAFDSDPEGTRFDNPTIHHGS